MPAIIHLSDNNLLIQQDGNWSRSQGYAWLRDGEVYFDLDQQQNAVLNCRLEPQQINSRYWQQCEQTSIAANDSGMRHAADLVWRHLTELKNAHKLDQVVLVVPSHYQAGNLQLLLGIARSCGLQVVALVNKAVLALHQPVTQDGRYLHIDVQLHQTVCSQVVATDASLKLGKIEILHEVGLQHMQDSLLKAIQDRFILSDRFDPLHYAETEQQLFNQLPKLAGQLASDSKANVSVSFQGRQHGTSIDQKQWQAAIKEYALQLTAFEKDPAISHCFCDLNGFQALQFSAERTTVLTKPTASLEALQETKSVDQDGNLIYRTELPLLYGLQERSVGTVEQKPPVTESAHVSAAGIAASGNDFDNAATHLLQAGVAVPLALAQIATENNQLKLVQARESNVAQLLASQQVFIMSDINRRELQVDDRLGSNLGDGVITVIRVVEAKQGGLGQA